MKMLWKVLVVTGVLTVTLGALGIIGGLVQSFQSMHLNETAGIGAVGGGLTFMLMGTVAGIFGLLLIVVGLVLFIVSRRENK